MVNRRSFSGIFLFLIKEDVFPFLQKSWNSSWWIKLISQQVRFWEFFIKSPAFREKHQLAAFIIQYKIQKKGTFYNLKCKRFLKFMTLWKIKNFTLDDVTVTVTYEEMNNVPENLSMDFDSGNAVTRTVTTKNLGNIWICKSRAESWCRKKCSLRIQLQNKFRKMKVRLKGNLPNTSVTLKLYNTNGTEAASRTSVV